VGEAHLGTPREVNSGKKQLIKHTGRNRGKKVKGPKRETVRGWNGLAMKNCMYIVECG